DASPRVRLLSSYGVARLALGEMDEGMSHLRESLRLAEESGNGFLRLIARLPLVAALHATGPLGEALALSEEAEALGRDAPELDAEVGASPLGLLLAHRTSVLVHLGRFEEAERAARPAMDVARAGAAAGAAGGRECRSGRNRSLANARPRRARPRAARRSPVERRGGDARRRPRPDAGAADGALHGDDHAGDAGRGARRIGRPR